jgi:hypothetical protein
MDRQKGGVEPGKWITGANGIRFVHYCLRTQQLAYSRCTTTLISKRLCVSFSFYVLADNHQMYAHNATGGEGSTSACDLSTQVACRNHPSICIELERVQDGVADCPDASDEGESNPTKPVSISLSLDGWVGGWMRLLSFQSYRSLFGRSSWSHHSSISEWILPFSNLFLEQQTKRKYKKPPTKKEMRDNRYFFLPSWWLVHTRLHHAVLH